MTFVQTEVTEKEAIDTASPNYIKTISIEVEMP